MISNYMRLLARLILTFQDDAVMFLRSAGDDCFGRVLETWLYAVRPTFQTNQPYSRMRAGHAPPGLLLT